MASFKKISVGNNNSIHADTIIIDRAATEVIYASMIGYSTLTALTIKDLNVKSTACYIPGAGNYRTCQKGYQIESKKNSDSDYTHTIAYAKDTIQYNEDGSELLDMFIFIKNESELKRKIFDKISKYSSIPILEEWMDYIISELQSESRMRQLHVISKYDVSYIRAYRVFFNKKNLKNIIQRGLQLQVIKIAGKNTSSPILNNLAGLNDYLTTFGEILAEKIQSAFKPKFIPGEDKYEEYTNFVDDFMFHDSDIELFEAQKTIIQSVTNNLKVNKSTFVIAEMGSGKTTMGAAIPYAHNANINKGFNTIVMCPSHLTIKWKREIEDRIPNAKAYILTDFKDLKALEPKLLNKNKVENTYLIVSKERAKMGYDNRPAAVWKPSKNTFICPDCGQILYTISYEGTGRNKREIHTPFNKLDMSRELAHNKVCMNTISKWNSKENKYDIVPCNSPLWGPLNRDDQEHNWFKLGSEGWILKEHIVPVTESLLNQEKLSKKDSALFKKILEQYNLIQDGEEPYNSYKGPKKYPISKYIRIFMKDVFDYCIVDEVHEMKGLTEQGQACADLIQASKKSILLTGTLLNGYADGLYYLLWRTVPKIMVKEGFKFSDEAEFAKMYGVHSRETRYSLTGGQRERRIGSAKDKRLPGVSPLVFTKFLLDNAVFLSLSDMSSGLPGYEEIPIPVLMDDELRNTYNEFENAFVDYATSGPDVSKKAVGPFLQSLACYPDCPHIVYPISDPKTGDLIYMPTNLPKQSRNKDTRLLELVQEKLDAGEKVLVFYSFVNKTDIGASLLDLFKKNNIKAFEMKSTTAPDKREEWVEKHLDKGMEVMICNPSLVETGLDLLEFTNIVFYQMGYNLFTMRQASRRSWRLSQSKDVKVYFMHYQNSIQEQSLALMATKLQAAMAIEGKFSEEGLRAMSNNEDLLTQIANNVVEGIKGTVNQEIFKANAFIKDSNKINRVHATKPEQLKYKLNSIGNRTIFSNELTDELPKRKAELQINNELLNNPISLFI